MKRVSFQEPYEKVSRNFFSSHIFCVKERIRIITWSLMRIRAWSSLTLRASTPAARSMIYVIIQSRILMTITDIEFLICPTTMYGTHTYTFRKSLEELNMELIGERPRLFFKLLTVFQRQPSIITDWLILNLARADTGNRTSTERPKLSWHDLRSVSVTFWEKFPFWLPVIISSTYKLFLLFWGYSQYGQTLSTSSSIVRKTATVIEFKLPLNTIAISVHIYN